MLFIMEIGGVYRVSSNSQYMRMKMIIMPLNDVNLNEKSTVPSTTEAVVEFTAVSDNSRHRIRFVTHENQTNMHRIHEIKSSRQWEVVEIDVVDEIRISTGDCENTFPVLSNGQP